VSASGWEEEKPEEHADIEVVQVQVAAKQRQAQQYRQGGDGHGAETLAAADHSVYSPHYQQNRPVRKKIDSGYFQVVKKQNNTAGYDNQA
jgi:hypothetical protein